MVTEVLLDLRLKLSLKDRSSVGGKSKSENNYAVYKKIVFDLNQGLYYLNT